MRISSDGRQACLVMAVLLAAVCTPSSGRAADVRRQGSAWVLENARLRVTVDPAPGRISVLDRKSGHEWRQPGAVGAPEARLAIRRLAAPPTVDGSLSEWTFEPTVRLTHLMTTGDAPKVDSDADCSASVWCAWDPDNLFVAARVRDDVLKFAPRGSTDWWERDSLEVWIGGRQIGLRLSPAGSEALTLDGPLASARVACRTVPGGYAVEAALPWSILPDAPRRQPGAGFRFAVGVNDADAAGAREGQLYFPASWAHSQPSTFAQAELADQSGALPPMPESAADRFRGVKEIPGGIAFESAFGATKGKPNLITVSLRLPNGTADLAAEAQVADSTAPWDNSAFLEPFVLGTPEAVLAVADYCDGHLYPLSMDPFPRTWFDGGRLDMPFVGVCDLKKGFGYDLILETSDDAWVQCRPYTIGGRKVYAPQVGWLASKGTFGYPRRLVYRFEPSGGYVALAKAYRKYAQANGLIVPFREKLKRNPNIRRLFGAPDVWGDASLAFAKQAKAAGVDKMLIHGRSTPDEMKQINALGYLTSEYDNYTDVLPAETGKQPDSSHDLVPEHVVLNADGKRMAAWLTYDKKTQYMKRCPTFWVPTARLVIPALLKTHPFLGRFIDVTTAEGLYECYDPAHPLTKAQKRECGQNLEAYVRSNGLVVGGEHGIWWGAPHQDYVEGMMSGNRFGWPAGHLIHPKNRQEKFAGPYGTDTWEAYDRWSMGHEWRAPLWELVFHDCVVTTWYWGDSNDYLLDADPGNQAKKDAFNILYGTMPMLWADRQGSWQKDRAAFLRTYRNVCKVHEAVADSELLSHEFLTPDHALQRTRFANGVVCIVNFGEKPQRAALGGKRYLLPQNGWAVQGPGIEQSRSIQNGAEVTLVRGPGYISEEENGHATVARALSDTRIRVQADAGKLLYLDPTSVVRRWDVGSTRVFALDGEGRRLRQDHLARRGNAIRLDGRVNARTEIVCGREAKAPDLQIGPSDVVVVPAGALRQGAPASVRVTVHNLGGAAVGKLYVAVYADTLGRDHRLATREMQLAGDSSKALSLAIPTAKLDGPRRLIVNITCGLSELCDRNNRVERRVMVQPDFSRWPERRMLRVNAGDVDRQDVVREYSLSGVPLDPASVRVALCDGQGRPLGVVPSQCGRAPGGARTALFQIPGKMSAGTTLQVALLFAPVGGPVFLQPSGTGWSPETRIHTGTHYSARFVDGTLREIGPPGKPCISHLMYSSAETGWTEEPGTVQKFEVLEDGPVRTVVHASKALLAGVVTDKTYAFYADRIDVSGSVNRPIGVFSRAYYSRPGQYEDSGGFRAKLDGQGDAEDVSNRARNPQWYAVYADTWAMSCVALSPVSDITYWDNPGAWGGVGFNTSQREEIRMSYVFHAGATSADFARLDARRLSSPVRVQEEGRPGD